MLSGTLGGETLDSLGWGEGGFDPGGSHGLTVVLPADTHTLVLTKGNSNSVVTYVQLHSADGTPSVGDYVNTYTAAPATTFVIDSSNDRIWLKVTSEDGLHIGYFWVIVTLAAPIDVVATNSIADGTPTKIDVALDVEVVGLVTGDFAVTKNATPYTDFTATGADDTYTLTMTDPAVSTDVFTLTITKTGYSFTPTTVTNNVNVGTITVNNSVDLVAAGNNSAVNTIILGSSFSLEAPLILDFGTKTVDLNGKSLTVAGFPITVNALSPSSILKDGTITGAAVLGGDGSDFAVNGVDFVGTVETTNTNLPGNNIAFKNGSISGAVTSTVPAQVFNGTALEAAITPGAGTFFTNLTITGAVTASHAASYNTVLFNGIVTASTVASTFTPGNIFTTTVENLTGDSDYTGSIFNGPVINTDGAANYTDAVFNNDLTVSAGGPTFGTANAITGYVVDPGLVFGSTKVTYTPGTAHTLRYVKQAGAFDATLAGTNASAIGAVYTSGADIAGAAGGEHVGLYEISSTGLVVKFIDITLSAGDIKVGVLDHIFVTPSTASVATDATQQFTATGYDAGSNVIPGTTVDWSWTSGDLGTISMSYDGLATGGHIGTVTIIATDHVGGVIHDDTAVLTITTP